MNRPSLLLLLPLALVACADKSIGLGLGAEPDARLTADLRTWPCASTDTGGGPSTQWEGVFAYDLSLEYAPDALTDHGFPETGCTVTADVFPTAAGDGGTDLPDVDEPAWSNGSMTGSMPHVSTGFYAKSVLANQHSCQEATDLLGEGTLLDSAGAFTGAQTPAPGEYTGVEVTGDVDPVTGIRFGADVSVAWTANGWNKSWVQVRREKGDQLLQAVTCNTTGSTSFDIDSTVWSLLSDALEVDVTNLYVAVENEGETTMSDGQIIETTTRAMHVAVVQDN